MPKISKTEEAALQAGTVGFDGELFNGNPSLANLIKKYDVSLREDETAFMNDQVEKLCAMLDDYEVTRDRDMPENVWDYLKREKVTKSPRLEIRVSHSLTTASSTTNSSLEWLFPRHMAASDSPLMATLK
jgi:hypothetical protein